MCIDWRERSEMQCSCANIWQAHVKLLAEFSALGIELCQGGFVGFGLRDFFNVAPRCTVRMRQLQLPLEHGPLHSVRLNS